MKVLLLNGSPHEKGCTYTALKEVAETLNREGVETEVVWLGNTAVQPCVACVKCHRSSDCVFDDIVNEINHKANECDGLIVGSPTHYSQASGQTSTFLSRLFYSNGALWKHKAAAAVVSCRRGGNAATFEQINQYFLMNEMNVVGSCYWNMVYGNTPEEVAKDAEGLHTMRTLAYNMAYLMKCQKIARENGMEPTVDKGSYRTNFMDGK